MVVDQTVAQTVVQIVVRMVVIETVLVALEMPVDFQVPLHSDWLLCKSAEGRLRYVLYSHLQLDG